jgi:hypothetical protein
MAYPFNLDCPGDFAWPIHLEPLNRDSVYKESFQDWWERVKSELSHLAPDLCEQWIYRHWTNSPFTFLPLNTLNWERKSWDGKILLSSIYRAWGGELHPQFDYDTFQRKGGNNRHPTALALDQGTWDYPMILLSTPNGVVDNGHILTDVRFVIVEGHQRHRYLNALHVLGRPPSGPHDTICISSPAV